jgi:hypothetical protein
MVRVKYRRIRGIVPFFVAFGSYPARTRVRRGFESKGSLRQHTTDGLLLVQVPPAFDLELRRGRSSGSEGYARQIRGQIPPPGNGLQ